MKYLYTTLPKLLGMRENKHAEGVCPAVLFGLRPLKKQGWYHSLWSKAPYSLHGVTPLLDESYTLLLSRSIGRLPVYQSLLK